LLAQSEGGTLAAQQQTPGPTAETLEHALFGQNLQVASDRHLRGARRGGQRGHTHLFGGADLWRALTEDIAQITGWSADADLVVIIEALLAATGQAPSRRDIEQIYTRAIARGNLLAASICCGVLTMIALDAADPSYGLTWVDKGIAAHLRQGGRESSHFVEGRANFLALAGDYQAAAVFYGATAAQTRRSGLMWPRLPATEDLLARIQKSLTTHDFLEAWNTGDHMTPEQSFGLAEQSD
jgi:hypothetical protein